jgi:hypothetical protein
LCSGGQEILANNGENMRQSAKRETRAKTPAIATETYRSATVGGGFSMLLWEIKGFYRQRANTIRILNVKILLQSNSSYRKKLQNISCRILGNQ